MSKNTAFAEIKSLVEKFDNDRNHYLSSKYNEAQARVDFLNPFFESLGWDVSNRNNLPPTEREVVVEQGETDGLVYELYNLTEEEIAIIEGNNK